MASRGWNELLTNKKFMKKPRFKSEVIDRETYYSVSIKLKGLVFWIDAEIVDGQWSFDWNQYIFHLTDSDDLKRRAIQDDCNNFEIACLKAENVLSKQLNN